ncbi:MocR-like pyridoxine biosynthesis transcription factor PdxR [Paenibacillus sp. y28]|uniref:MocR-like pyridoxine biosynthesis transcription factor PdxR n=1 Tax=Paenibacillus sp. y28 TaxID=3129110 RepID=UPI0030198F39
MTLLLTDQSGEALYLQIYRHLRGEITAGRIAAGTRLPSVRKLAADLALSRTPVELAYQQLIAEGYAKSRPRSGLYAQSLAHDQLVDVPAASPRQNKAASAKQKERTAKYAVDHMDAAEAGFTGLPAAAVPGLAADNSPDGSVQPKPEYDFHYGSVDLAYFPFTQWSRLAARCCRPENRGLLLYGQPQGEPGLRRQIAQYAHQARGVDCTPGQVIVGAGTHNSLEQLCQLLRDPYGPQIALEAAVSDGVAMVVRQNGWRLQPVPLDKDGLRIDALYESGARVVYVTPSHQFPYGMIMPIARRLQLLKWAEDVDGMIIENDYDGEFRYEGRPIPALQGLDRSGRVAYLGTFSKAIAPAVRLSYLILPLPLARKMDGCLHTFDQFASPLHQSMVEQFIAEGHFERHIRKMRQHYRLKHAALIQAVKAELGPQVQVIGDRSGLHIVLEFAFPQGEDAVHTERSLIAKALAAGVRVYPTSAYTLSGAKSPLPTIQPRLLLGFGGLSIESIQHGIRSLGKAWELYSGPI